MGRIRVFPLLVQNGCSQSSRFPTAGQGERKLWERDCCVGCKERMPSCICLGWAFDCLLNEEISQREKNWRFVIIIEVLRNVNPTRVNILIVEHFSISKVKLNAKHNLQTIKTMILNKRGLKGYQLRGVDYASLSCVSKGIIASV